MSALVERLQRTFGLLHRWLFDPVPAYSLVICRVGLGSVLLAHPDWARDARKGYSFDENEHQPTSDTLVSLAVPKPVVRYLVKCGRVRDDS